MTLPNPKKTERDERGGSKFSRKRAASRVTWCMNEPQLTSQIDDSNGVGGHAGGRVHETIGMGAGRERRT